MHIKDELKLIEACKHNNRTAQKVLYNRFAPYMMATALRYTGDNDTAEDIVQEAFIKIFGSLHQYAAQGTLAGWVHRITVNVALEYLRSNNILMNSIDTEEVMQLPALDDSVIEKMSADELLAVIASLPVGFRTVFNMYAVEGYSHKEISQILGIQESTSRSQYLRAKAYIQRNLEELK